MSSIFLAAIADDDTGATDLAGMLTAQGMRAILLLADCSAEQLACWAEGSDAVILGTASRSIPKHEAYARTLAAARLLQSLRPRRLAVKYCSTFDSTPEGNIGASLDALLDATGERFITALPALPALGRTTYMGYHFVGQQLLSDSVLRQHPLNPMTNPHLPSHLQTQTSRRVGLASYADVTAGTAALEAKLATLAGEGVEIALVDCVDARQLVTIGEAIQHHRVLSGSSAWAMVLPQLWKQTGAWEPVDSQEAELRRSQGGTGTLIVSGSCSEATWRQNEWAHAQDFCMIDLNAVALAQAGAADEAFITRAADTLRAGQVCVLTTTRAAGKRDVEAWAETQGMTAVAAGERISSALSSIVESVAARCMPTGLIVAGGETSSTLMRSLSLGGLRVGQNIEPGVPLCVSLARPALAVVLKSGNFGSEDFYGRAISAIAALPTSEQSQRSTHA